MPERLIQHADAILTHAVTGTTALMGFATLETTKSWLSVIAICVGIFGSCYRIYIDHKNNNKDE